MNLTVFEREKLIEYLESFKLIIETYDIEELVDERNKYCNYDIEMISKLLEKVSK